MTGAKRELRDLIAEMRIQFDKVREKSAWLDLKQAEFRPDDEIALWGLMQAKEQLTIEQSVLAGHAQLVQERARDKRVKLTQDNNRFMDTIRQYARRLP